MHNSGSEWVKSSSAEMPPGKRLHADQCSTSAGCRFHWEQSTHPRRYGVIVRNKIKWNKINAQAAFEVQLLSPCLWQSCYCCQHWSQCAQRTAAAEKCTYTHTRTRARSHTLNATAAALVVYMCVYVCVVSVGACGEIAYFPSSSYSWYSSVNLVEVTTVAMSTAAEEEVKKIEEGNEEGAEKGTAGRNQGRKAEGNPPLSSATASHRFNRRSERGWET